MEIVLGIVALIAATVAVVVSVSRYRKSERVARTAAEEREAWTFEQMARWRRGELTAKQEPSVVGAGEPVPGHRIVVGKVGKSVSGQFAN